MKFRTLALMSTITLFAALATPVRRAAQVPQMNVEAVNSLATTSTANPVPLINQPLVPDAVKPGSAGFTLTVNGTGFVSGAVVKWNGSPRTTTFVSGSRLTVAILATDIAKTGTASVTVVNPTPGGGTSNPAFLLITTPAASVGFNTTDYVFGQSPIGAAVGDFNEDGILDLAVAEQPGTNTVNVLLGNGDGTFRTPVSYATGGGARWIAVDDFNGDGKLDLAVVGETSSTVSILLGNGDGTFQAPMTFATGSGPYFAITGDFNRDGRQDLAIANLFDNTVSILLGNGDGTFQPQETFATGSGPDAIETGDFNGDGKLDLVTANAAGSFSILLGNGDGTFQSHLDYPEGGNPSVAIADFNGDGRLDLAFASQNSSTISVLLGRGDGTFQSPLTYATGAGPGLVIAADLNGDGRLDLVTSNYDFGNGTSLSILLGNGDGTFQPHMDVSAGQVSGYLAAGDFNGDGRLDLAAPGNGGVIILLQAPTVSLSKTSLTFADQLVGTRSATQTVTFTNGALPLIIDSIAVNGTNATDFGQTNTCASGLPPGGKCIITVTFTPTHIGPRAASVTITDNAAGSPQGIALSGTGVVSGPNATLSPTSLTFATQLVGTTSPSQLVTLSNYGTVTLSITSIAFTGTDPADFAQTNTCNGSVAPGTPCTISVTFKPTQGGPRTATLSITDNAPGSPQTVSLSGTGTVVKLNPVSLGFGTVALGSSSTKGTTLTNFGSTTLNITSITSTPNPPFSQTNTCRSSVGAGLSCTISVTFRPSSTGTFRGSVSVSDDGGASPQLVPLSGCSGKCKLLASAVPSALAATRSAAAPSPTGPSHVGTRVIDLVDSTRADPYLANGTKRELLVRFWYPASVSQGCQPAEYASPAVWSYFSQLAAVPFPEVKTNSCLDAPITDGAHPVVVFTHGFTGTFTDYTFIFEDLASRGYVVASVDHTYEATVVEFPDGRFVKSVLGSHWDNTWRTDQQTLSSAVSVRLGDLRFVVDELERLNSEADSPFAGKLDTGRLAVAGHSLGGMAALPSVLQDTRFKAGVLIDGWPDTLTTPTQTPVLILAAGHEQWSDGERGLWNNLRGPRMVVNLEGAEHVTPSDLVWLAKGAVKTGSMGPENTIAAVRSYIAAFLDANLRGKPPAPLLRGPSLGNPDAVVTTKKPLPYGEAKDHSAP